MKTSSAWRYMDPGILLADRDPELTEAVRQILKSFGQEIRTCNSGLGCMELLKEHQTAILVVDADLLWGGGDGVVDWLSAEESLLPQMVVVTSDPQSPSLPDRLEPWVDVRIPRPQSDDQLLSFVNQLETLIWWCKSPNYEPMRTSPKFAARSASRVIPKC